MKKVVVVEEEVFDTEERCSHVGQEHCAMVKQLNFTEQMVSKALFLSSIYIIAHIQTEVCTENMKKVCSVRFEDVAVPYEAEVCLEGLQRECQEDEQEERDEVCTTNFKTGTKIVRHTFTMSADGTF